MFGLPEALMSFIRRQVGLRTDAASSTGSAHAKLADIRSAIAARPVLSVQRGYTLMDGYIDTTKSVTITAVNMSKAFVTSSVKCAHSDYTRPDETFCSVQLTSTTTIEISRGYKGAESSDDVYVSWEVIQLA